MYKDIEEAARSGAALQGYSMFLACSFRTSLLQPLHRYRPAQEPEDKAPDTLFTTTATDSGVLVILPSGGWKRLRKT